jgi:hypothetical protein
VGKARRGGREGERGRREGGRGGREGGGIFNRPKRVRERRREEE